MVNLAKSLEGLPYKYGGKDLDGFDCSGLVFYVYDCFGVKVPRTARKQGALKKKRVSLRKAEPADILIFKLKSRWHSAIFVGGKTFIHAPNRNDVIRCEHLKGFWKKRLKYVIRLVNE